MKATHCNHPDKVTHSFAHQNIHDCRHTYVHIYVQGMLHWTSSYRGVFTFLQTQPLCQSCTLPSTGWGAWHSQPELAPLRDSRCCRRWRKHYQKVATFRSTSVIGRSRWGEGETSPLGACMYVCSQLADNLQTHAAQWLCSHKPAWCC